MLKTKQGRTPFIPSVADWEIYQHLGPLSPPERNALRHIVDNATLLPGDDQVSAVLVVAITPDMIDVLACFESELAEMEREHDDEAEEDDDKEWDTGTDAGWTDHHNEDREEDEVALRAPYVERGRAKRRAGKLAANEIDQSHKARAFLAKLKGWPQAERVRWID